MTMVQHVVDVPEAREALLAPDFLRSTALQASRRFGSTRAREEYESEVAEWAMALSLQSFRRRPEVPYAEALRRYAAPSIIRRIGQSMRRKTESRHGVAEIPTSVLDRDPGCGGHNFSDGRSSASMIDSTMAVLSTFTGFRQNALYDRLRHFLSTSLRPEARTLDRVLNAFENSGDLERALCYVGVSDKRMGQLIEWLRSTFGG